MCTCMYIICTVYLSILSTVCIYVHKYSIPITASEGDDDVGVF